MEENKKLQKELKEVFQGRRVEIIHLIHDTLF